MFLYGTVNPKQLLTHIFLEGYTEPGLPDKVHRVLHLLLQQKLACLTFYDSPPHLEVLLQLNFYLTHLSGTLQVPINQDWFKFSLRLSTPRKSRRDAREMYQQKPQSYAPATFSYSQPSLLNSTINLDEVGETKNLFKHSVLTCPRK